MLTYGSESWLLTKKDENLLLSFERKVLRTIFGTKLEDGRHRRRYNFELEQDFGEPNIIAVVKCNRLRWAGHLVRMDSELQENYLKMIRMAVSYTHLFTRLK